MRNLSHVLAHNSVKSLALTVLCFFGAVSAHSSQKNFGEFGGGYAATGQLKGIGFSSKIYDATNGLPTSDANFILGSKDGYVWLGGYNGVIRYDGTIFERLSTSAGLTSGRAFFEDSRNRIWVGTNDNGVVVIEGEKSKRYTYKDALPASSIRSFAEDKSGNIFIATSSGLAFVSSSGLLYPLPDSRLSKEEVVKLESDSTGKIYGQTTNGIIFVIINRNVTKVYSSEELGMQRITAMLVDPFNPGKLYLCDEGGTIYYGDFGTKSSQMDKIDILPIKTAQWICYECGRVWVCSATQIGYLDSENKFVLIPNLPLTSAIQMLTSDYQGNIWACSSTQGVMKVVSNNFVNISKEAKLPKKTTYSTCLHNDCLYIGTETGLFIIDKNKHELKNALTEFISDSRVRCIIEDNEKNLWIGTFTNEKGLVCQDAGGKITSFTTKNGMPNNMIRTLKLSQNGSIICGTNNGLAIIKDKKVIKTFGTEEIIKNPILLTVEEASDGRIYAGSNGDGIYVINGSKITRYGRDEGLTSDVVMRIKEDKKHDVLWIVTSNSLQYMQKGMIKNVSSFPYNNNYDLYINKDDEVWILASSGIYTANAEDLLSDEVNDYRLYTIANGLPSTVTANSFSTQDEKGNLYVCCREGVSCVNIDAYSEQSSQTKAAINSIFCGNKKILPNEKGVYIIPASKERIKFMASVMDYTMANPPVRIFLEGAGGDGITVNQNELCPLEYTGLSYGSYKFHIQVLSHNKKEVLLDKAIEIIKIPQLYEVFFIRIFLISMLVLIAGFIVWRIMKSTIITKQYKQIQLAKEEAELANKTKSRFLSNMSQEIITPINTILSMDEMILRENAKDVPKDYFHSIMNYGESIRTASESLLNLINDLLEMTKIESGKLSLSETEYDVKDLFRSVVMSNRVKSSDKHLKFEVSIDNLIPCRLYGDVGKIKHVLLNLLSNAIKYTEEGGVILQISMEGRTDNMCDLCLRVTDTGNGMKPEIIETIFDAYGAFEKDAKDMHLKTGLGLDISRRFAEMMGGVLVCTSDVGKGSEFIFTLTQKIIDQTPIGIFTENDDVEERGPYIPEFIAPDADVIVASENFTNLCAIENLLKATKVFITSANSRQDFIDKIRDNSFNVAFVDHLLFESDMKVLDELISQVKHFAPALSVYIITENSSSGEDFYKNKGFDGMLSLPIDPVLLEKTIMKHLPKEMMEIPKKIKEVE